MTKKDYFTRLKTWEECLQAADGCYYSTACKEPAIGAHAVSQAWLRTRASQGKVYWFSRHKGLPKEMSEALKKSADESTLFQLLRESQPSLEPIGRATRAKFCCEQHDRVFNSIDSRSNMDLQTPNDHHLNLMFYRALLRQLHVDTAAKTWRGKDPRDRRDVGISSHRGWGQHRQPATTQAGIAAGTGREARGIMACPTSGSAHAGAAARSGCPRCILASRRREGNGGRFEMYWSVGLYGNPPQPWTPCGLPLLHNPTPRPPS